MFQGSFGRRTGASLVALSLALAAAAPMAARAEDTAKPRESTIIVTGEGTSEMAPDMALMDLGVVKDAKTAREALDATAKHFGVTA